MVNALTKAIVNVLSASAILAAASGGQALAGVVMSWAPGDIGVSESASFDGYSDAYLGGSAPVPGLSSELTLTLHSIVSNKWTFDYKVANTSTDPIDASRVTVFGFDVQEPYAGVVSSGEFNSPGSGWAPLVGLRNLCFRTFAVGACRGSWFGGVSKGDSKTGWLTLKYTAAQAGIQLQNLFVVYQGVSSRQLCLCDQQAVGQVNAVPEPSTWAMMIIGLGGLGAAMRRRRCVL
jgi:hypothetical protein